MAAEKMLAVNIGNTWIQAAWAGSDERIRVLGRIPTDTAASRLPGQIQTLLETAPSGTGRRPAVGAVVYCSVVPRVQERMQTACARLLPEAAQLVLGHDIAFPLRSRYRPARTLGHDRLANAVAVSGRYPLPAVIIDCGTAITVDWLTARSVVAGGLILPGRALQVRALHEHSAQLPLIRIEPPLRSGILGRSTAEGIAYGVNNGSRYAIEGIVQSFQRRYGTPASVIVTGGDAAILRSSQLVTHFDNILTLKGIVKTYKMMKKRDK